MNIIVENDGVVFNVRVIPRSSRSEIVGEHEGALKVKLSSPPVDGAANGELIKLIAKKLGVSRSAVTILSGEAAKTKRLRVIGITERQYQDALKR